MYMRLKELYSKSGSYIGKGGKDRMLGSLKG
jgi:hypothetical protein